MFVTLHTYCQAPSPFYFFSNLVIASMNDNKAPVDYNFDMYGLAYQISAS